MINAEKFPCFSCHTTNYNYSFDDDDVPCVGCTFCKLRMTVSQWLKGSIASMACRMLPKYQGLDTFQDGDKWGWFYKDKKRTGFDTNEEAILDAWRELFVKTELGIDS